MIRRLAPSDAAPAERLVEEVLGSGHQARCDELIDVLALPGFGAWRATELVGVAMFAERENGVELAALAVVTEWRGRGIGGELVDAVVAESGGLGHDRLWLVTTNDNVGALVLYQRKGFRLVEVRGGAVDRARERLKPAIPVLGQHGIPMRDELVLERQLRATDDPGAPVGYP